MASRTVQAFTSRLIPDVRWVMVFKQKEIGFHVVQGFPLDMVVYKAIPVQENEGRPSRVPALRVVGRHGRAHTLPLSSDGLALG